MMAAPPCAEPGPWVPAFVAKVSGETVGAAAALLASPVAGMQVGVAAVPLVACVCVCVWGGGSTNAPLC